MTEPTQPDTTQRDDRTRVEVAFDDTGDFLLEVLARLAQESGIGLGITLNVGGILVAGTIVGRDKWFDELATTAAEADADIGEFMRMIRDSITRPRVGDDEAETRYTFLHLRDATVEMGGVVAMPQSLWRVRIAEVSGWTLGRFARAA